MLSFFTADPLSTEKQSFPFKINPYSLLLLHFLTNSGRRFPVLGSIISHLARLPQSSDDPLFHGQRKRRNHFRLEHHLLCCIFCQQLTLFTLKGLSNTHTATSTTGTAFLTIRVWLHYFLFDFFPLLLFIVIEMSLNKYHFIFLPLLLGINLFSENHTKQKFVSTICFRSNLCTRFDLLIFVLT